MNNRIALYGFLNSYIKIERNIQYLPGKQLLFCFTTKKTAFRYTKNISGGELQWIL